MSGETDKGLIPAPEDRVTISYEEMATGEAAARVDSHETLVEGDDSEVTLLDPILAYQREAQRMRRAGPRRRMTADDLDRRGL